VVVLGYHRVADDGWDPYSLSISPANFAGHLAGIRELANPVGLSELASGLKRGSLPRRAVVDAAKPLLQENEVPATVFVVADCLGQEFWWDEMARLLAAGTHVPGMLRLDTEHGWTVVEDGGSHEDPDRLLVRLHRLVARMPGEERRGLIDELRSIVGTPANAVPAARGMDEGELRRLADGPWIDVGSHTRTHPILSALPQHEQWQEIEGSREKLESLLGRPVTCFSYPNGSHSEVTRRLVAEAGFSCGCCSGADVVLPDSDRFALPRFWPPNCSGSAFAGWLGRWL
jgi:peptidoglycan/xylan/chitin deacetylase (PgdA/CDA1 family)